MKPQRNQVATARKPVGKAPLQTTEGLPLRSSGAIVFAGLCYLFTGFAFSYVDRGRLAFGVFCVLWLAWALLGFGAGVFNLRGRAGAGHGLWRGMALMGVVLAVFPGILLYPFARWICLVLMVVMAARAAQMRTRRDLYFTMTVVFTVCFLTTTHYAADWSLWFYLGPAWLFGALALAWLHAEGVDLSRWTQLSMITGFVAVSCVIAACLFLFVPRPPVLGFGFLPDGDVPGLYDPPLGHQGDGSGQRRAGGSGGAGAQGGGWGDGHPGQSRPRQGPPPSRWDRMLDGMRDAGRDPFAPQWQRGAINGALDAAQALRNWLRGSGPAAPSSGEPGDSGEPPPPSGGAADNVNNLLVMLAMALVAWLLWRYRYRWGPRLALAAAWGLSRWFPVRSMQVSARAMTWCLRGRRHLPQPGQSVREHWSSAPGLAPLARQWTERALETYCATRFGGVPATPERALRLREDVLGAADIMAGASPELAR
ncbi:putative membrane protein YgcG [Acidovorax soli]|uniref:Putative membrane protein YgcG n=1 Tax=Acidovorax soli TaxID=592050 RepID=A0A7X0PMC7_9BURK|nr:transglutaminaseTgpA domain-containing protein [Acidovorax soli]MBB6564289.1 putative membrane protein YgcG [Acidovorax soli]